MTLLAPDRYPKSANRTPDIDRRAVLIGLLIAWTSRALPATGIAGASSSPSKSDIPLATSQEWLLLLITLFPHDSLDPALYNSSIIALNSAAAKDTAVNQLLQSGWNELRRGVPTSWTEATPIQRNAALLALSGGPFFALLRRTVAFTLYNDPATWSAFSYDGDAWRFGGWLGRPEFGVLTWLPEPPQ